LISKEISEDKIAVLEFVRRQYEQSGIVPSIVSILKNFGWNRTYLYRVFQGGLSQICKEASVQFPAERSKVVEAALATRRKRIAEGVLVAHGEGVDSELEKTIFSLLNAGVAPEKIVEKIGHMDVVDLCFRKWKIWRADDYRKGQEELRVLGRELGLDGIGDSVSDGVCELGRALRRAGREKESMNERIERLENACTYHRKRFDGARFVYARFVREIVKALYEFHVQLHYSKSDDYTIDAMARLYNKLVAEASAATGPLNINPDDPIIPLIGSYVQIFACALKEHVALVHMRSLEQLRSR